MTLQEMKQAIGELSLEERKQLMMFIVETFPDEESQPERYSILDFAGFAAHLRDQDAQEYVNELRSAWDDRP